MLYLILIAVSTMVMFGSQRLLDYSADGSRCIPIHHRNIAKITGIILEHIAYAFVLAGIASFTINNF